MGLLPKGRGHVRVAQQTIVRDPGVRIADQKPAGTGLGKPRQGTHLSSLRTTHPRDPEGALLGRKFRTAGAKRAKSGSLDTAE